MSYTLLETIKIRLRQFDTLEVGGEQKIVFNQKEENPILEQLIDKARLDIIDYRHYPDTYTIEMIDEDIDKRYRNILIDLVLYDYSIEGMDYENNHSENGVFRTFNKREAILGKVVPFVKII